MVSTNVFFNRLFGSTHPYGFQAYGSEVTVNAITLDAVKDFYSTYYVPGNATLIAVGDLGKEEFVALAKTSFGAWKQKKVARTEIGAPPAKTGTTIYIVDKANAPQSQIRIGNPGVARNTEDYFAVSLLNQILGSSNGRLYLNLREAKGYTYGAYSQFIMRRSAGPFMAYAGVRTDVTDSSVTEFLKEINRLRDEPVPEEEFAMYKAAMIQRLPRIFETPGQISGQLGSVVLYDLPDTYFDGLVDGYKKVTREEVLRVAKKYMQPGNLSIVIVGDREKIAPKLEKLGIGQIVVCDDKGVELK
jgi:zinc protease